MEDAPVAVSNPWAGLAPATNGSPSRGGKRGRGGARGGGPGRGSPGKVLPTGSDAIAAFKGEAHNVANSNEPANGHTEWTTHVNRSNAAKSRRDPAHVRTIQVEEAIKELEAKSLAVHTGNTPGRTALWGQWCRRMEDTRLDVDCRYLDADGAAVSFDEVFVRSQALEHAVASVVRAPVRDDAELTFLFSHCLEGDAVFHRRLADGLKVVGECFRDCGRPVDEGFVERLVGILAALKVNPRQKRDAGAQTQRLDRDITFHIAKAQELARGDAPAAPEARHKCTSELVRLGTEKLRIVAAPSPASSVADSALQAAFDELVQVIRALLGEATNQHKKVQKQYDAFQSKVKMAMMGDDAEYLRVLKVDQDLDGEIRRLSERKRELQRQLEEVSMDLTAAENRKRQHAASSAGVIALYQQRMRAFQGEDTKMSGSYSTAQVALEHATRAHEFLAGLCDATLSTLAERRERSAAALSDGNRQVLGFLAGHAEAVRESLDLVERRAKFCAAKLESMQAELQEARDIGMPDLAADLAAAVAKFKDMQVQAHKGVEGGDAEVRRIEAALAQVGRTLDPADKELAELRAKVAERLAEICEMRASIGAARGANGK